MMWACWLKLLPRQELLMLSRRRGRRRGWRWRRGTLFWWLWTLCTHLLIFIVCEVGVMIVKMMMRVCVMMAVVVVMDLRLFHWYYNGIGHLTIDNTIRYLIGLFPHKIQQSYYLLFNRIGDGFFNRYCMKISWKTYIKLIDFSHSFEFFVEFFFYLFNWWFVLVSNEWPLLKYQKFKSFYSKTINPITTKNTHLELWFPREYVSQLDRAVSSIFY